MLRRSWGWMISCRRCDLYEPTWFGVTYYDVFDYLTFVLAIIGAAAAVFRRMSTGKGRVLHLSPPADLGITRTNRFAQSLMISYVIFNALYQFFQYATNTSVYEGGTTRLEKASSTFDILLVLEGMLAKILVLYCR